MITNIAGKLTPQHANAPPVSVSVCLPAFTYRTGGALLKAGNLMKWKEFFDGNYEVSDAGEVRRKTPGRRTFPGKLLSRNIAGKGYYYVNPCRNGKNVSSYVHILVARAFLGDCPIGMEVNHIDGNKLNNNVDNLEYVTHRDNMRHARANRMIKDRLILSVETIVKVRELRSSGMSYSTVAEKTGVSIAHCWNIANNLTRKER